MFAPCVSAAPMLSIRLCDHRKLYSGVFDWIQVEASPECKHHLPLQDHRSHGHGMHGNSHQQTCCGDCRYVYWSQFSSNKKSSRCWQRFFGCPNWHSLLSQRTVCTTPRRTRGTRGQTSRFRRGRTATLLPPRTKRRPFKSPTCLLTRLSTPLNPISA